MAKKKEETVKITVPKGNLKIGDKPLDKLDINGTFLPIGEPPIESNIEEILQDIIPISVDEFILENILNSIDTIQTIERGKLELVKELILNSQKLEAISLLKTVQTAEYGKIQKIIEKLGQWLLPMDNWK